MTRATIRACLVLCSILLLAPPLSAFIGVWPALLLAGGLGFLAASAIM